MLSLLSTLLGVSLVLLNRVDSMPSGHFGADAVEISTINTETGAQMDREVRNKHFKAKDT